MPSMKDYLEALKQPLADFFGKSFKDFRDAAQKDIKDFLKESEEDLSRWTKLLIEGKITQREFGILVRSSASLGQLHALKQAGLAQARWDLFIDGVTDILVSTAVSVFLP